MKNAENEGGREGRREGGRVDWRERRNAVREGWWEGDGSGRGRREEVHTYLHYSDFSNVAFIHFKWSRPVGTENIGTRCLCV